MTAEEFDEMMQSLDRTLGDEGHPVLFRPLVAMTRLSPTKEFDLSQETDPSVGPYEWPNLALSVNDWYTAYYESQSVFPNRFHRRAVLIRGQVFFLRIPFMFNAFGKLRASEYIDDISPSLLVVLDEEETGNLQTKLDTFYRETSNILLCQTMLGRNGSACLCNELLKTGWADLKTCGEGFNQEDPAASLFPAQQAAEKYLKAFLVRKDSTVTSEILRKRFGHNVAKLVEACSLIESQFQKVNPHVELLSFGPKVRYERPKLSLPSILNTIDLSHAICNLVATLVIRDIREDAP